MPGSLSHYHDHDIDAAYALQQELLTQWGVTRTPVTTTSDKRVALGEWLFDLMVNERADYSRAILFDEAPPELLNKVVRTGYKVYRDTLDTLFAHPHEAGQLQKATSAMNAWIAQEEQQWLHQKETEIAARRLFGDSPININHIYEEDPKSVPDDEIDFFVVTGDNTSVGVYDNDTGNFIIPKLSDQVSKRRAGNENDTSSPNWTP